MKNAVKMGSGAMIYIPSFIEIGSAIQKLIGGKHIHTDSMVISYADFNFFENKESGLIKLTTIYNVQNIDHSSLTVHFILLYVYVYCLCLCCK
jgi:hypothetical protein